MSKRKYEKGKPICSMLDFVTSDSQWFILDFPNTPTRHRAVIEHFQYSTIQGFIGRGMLYEAKKKGG